METGDTNASEEWSLDVVHKDEILIVILLFLGLIGSIVAFIDGSHAVLLFGLLTLLRLLRLSIVRKVSIFIGSCWLVRVGWFGLPFCLYSKYIENISFQFFIYGKYMKNIKGKHHCLCCYNYR